MNTEQTIDHVNPILRRCCNTRPDAVSWTKAPFHLDGMLYATDGHSIARQPAPVGCEPISQGPPSNINSHVQWDRHLYVGEAVQVSVPEGPDMVACSKCRGQGVITCHHCGHDGECDDCRAAGVVEAPPVSFLEQDIGVAMRRDVAVMVHDFGGRVYPVKSEDKRPARAIVLFPDEFGVEMVTCLVYKETQFGA